MKSKTFPPNPRLYPDNVSGIYLTSSQSEGVKNFNSKFCTMIKGWNISDKNIATAKDN